MIVARAAFQSHKSQRRHITRITRNGRRGQPLSEFVAECGSMAIYPQRTSWDCIRENAK